MIIAGYLSIEKPDEAAIAVQYNIIRDRLSEEEMALVKAIATSDSGETKDIQRRLSNITNCNGIKSRPVRKYLINANEHEYSTDG